jgi:hypothetical protein
VWKKNCNYVFLTGANKFFFFFFFCTRFACHDTEFLIQFQNTPNT